MKPVLFMHVAAMGRHWKNLFAEQLEYLKATCRKQVDLRICLAGADEAAIFEESRKYGLTIEASNLPIEEFEFPTLSILYDHSVSNPGSIVGYAHTKGVSKDPFDLKNTQWRNYVQWACWEQFGRCMSAINDGADVVGADLISPRWFPVDHFSGNFWWARTDYIAKLPNIRKWRHPRWKRKRSMEQKDERGHIRFNAEFWIGMGNGNMVGLHKAPRQRFRKALWPRSAYEASPHPLGHDA